MSSTQEVSNHKSDSESSFHSVVVLKNAMARGDNYLIATGAEARRIDADVAEARRGRRRAAGGYLFQRDGSSHWQMKYRVGDKWRYESTWTENRK